MPEEPKRIDREMLDLINDSPVQCAIILTDGNNRVTLWNKGAERLLGYKSGEFVGQECLVDYKPVAQSNRLYNDLRYSEADTDAYSYRTNLLTRDGIALSVQIFASRERNAEGETKGHLFIIYDVTEEVIQKKLRLILVAIAQISAKRQPLTKVLEKCTAAIQSHLELPMVYLCINDSEKGLFARSYSGAQREYLSLHRSGGQNDKISEKCAECFELKELTCEEFSPQHVSGCLNEKINSDEPLYIVHAPLASERGIVGILHFIVPESLKKAYTEDSQILGLIAGKVASAVLTCRLENDLQLYADNLERIVKQRTDELRKKDAQIVQAGKLATLGEMATGIAHEINQPLGGISLMTQGIMKALHKGKLTDAILEERLNSISEQISRIDKIINHLRIFGRQAPELMMEVSANKTIMDVFDFIGQQLRKRNITIDIDMDENLPSVLAESNRLEQVLLNIIANARDALDNQEVLVQKLLAGNNPPSWAAKWEKRLYIRTYVDKGRVVVAIGDTGGGIREEIRDKIFEPFFTTKEVGKGTGLGLSISYGIIKEFNGDIKLVTEIDRGSTFFISFPVVGVREN